MKILFVSPTFYEYPHRIGGAETYIKNLAQALASHSEVSKVEILSFSSQKTGSWLDQKVSYNIYKSSMIKNNPSNPFPLFNFFTFFKYDIIYIHQFHTWLTFIAIFLGKILNKTIVLTDHNGGGATYNRKLNLDKFIDLFLTTSKLSFGEINLKPKRVATIYGGVDLKQFHPLSKNKNGILFVGRAHKIKGILPFLIAVKNTRYNERVTLALGVNFDNEDYFQNILDFLSRENLNNVVVKKNETKEQLIAEYQSHAWCILPSIDETPHESLGLTVLEGLACDTPVAVSPFCGVIEMFSEQHLSFVKIINNNDDFLKSLAQYQSTPGEARLWAEKNASWDTVAKRAVEEIKKSLI